MTKRDSREKEVDSDVGCRQLIDTPRPPPKTGLDPPPPRTWMEARCSHGQRCGCGGSRPHILPPSQATPHQNPLLRLARFQRASPCRQRTTPIPHARQSNGVGDKAAVARVNLIGDGRTFFGRHDLNVPENNDTDGTHSSHSLCSAGRLRQTDGGPDRFCPMKSAPGPSSR